MLYVKFFCGNGYCGCAIEDVLEFDDETLEKEIDEYVYSIAHDNAENYEHIAFGWNANKTEEEYDFYYENIEYSWDYITKEEFEKYQRDNY